MIGFIWKCPTCEAANTKTDPCPGCGYTPNLSEALCIHGHAFDMACDYCGRSGFRFDGVNMPEDMAPVEQVAQQTMEELEGVD